MRPPVHKTVHELRRTTRASSGRTPGPPRADRAVYREAEKLRTKLLSDADELKIVCTKSTVEALLERWMQQHEIDPASDLRLTRCGHFRCWNGGRSTPSSVDTPAPRGLNEGERQGVVPR